MGFTRTKSIFGIVLFSFLLNSCQTDAGYREIKNRNDKLQVVATTSMIADAVRILASDKVELYAMMGPGVDPHLYKATKSDIDNIYKADLILYNGLNLEAKVAEIMKNMGGNLLTVAVAEAIDSSLLRHPSEFYGYPDPHVWFDVSMWSTVVTEVTRTLVVSTPEHRDFFENNLWNYLDSLKILDEWVREQILTIPKERRVLVTAHDAFGYFGISYDIEVRGLQGISTISEAGLFDVTSMIDYLCEKTIKGVFVESSISSKSIEAVMEGCISRGHNIKIGGTLFSDAMGKDGTDEGTYLGMVRHNVNIIVSSLK